MFLVKYNANREIMNTCENLKIDQSHFFTNMLVFVYIQSNLNIYWFIRIWIHCQQIQTKSYSVTYSMSDITKVILNYSPLLNLGHFLKPTLRRTQGNRSHCYKSK
jgi:hypothetical protein